MITKCILSINIYSTKRILTKRICTHKNIYLQKGCSLDKKLFSKTTAIEMYFFEHLDDTLNVSLLMKSMNKNLSTITQRSYVGAGHEHL
jgi:hypothetical protein